MRIRSNEAGFTLIEIMVVVLIIGVIAALAIPNLLSAQQTAWANTCKANRSTIASAAELYRIQAGEGPSEIDDLYTGVNNYPAVLPTKPECPGGGTYSVETSEDQVISVYCDKHAPAGESAGEPAPEE